MIWLAGVAVVIAVAVLDAFTLRAVYAQTRSTVLRIVTAILLLMGVTAGCWIGCIFRYPWTETVQLQGFPIPIMAWQLEEGRWVDFVGILPLGMVNLFLVASVFLLPISLRLLLGRLWRWMNKVAD
jgi:hypothetical protein